MVNLDEVHKIFQDNEHHLQENILQQLKTFTKCRSIFDPCSLFAFSTLSNHIPYLYLNI